MNKFICNITSPWCVMKKFYCTSGEEVISAFGFKYYKRFPNQEIPSDPPSKLFMITRVKPSKGTPYWEKNILQELGLLDKHHKVSIVKNIPEVNAKLYKVKHLIKITPITFPNGPPSKEDIGATFLKENGELLVSKKLKVGQENLEASFKFAEKECKLDPKTLRKYLRYQWIKPYI